MCFCRAFAVLCRCQHGPGWTFWDGGNSLLCIFQSGFTCASAREAHLHRLTSESKNWKLSAVIQSCRGTIWYSEASPWYFKLERFSYITIPQCTHVACDCGVSSRSRFMFDSCWPVRTHKHKYIIGSRAHTHGEARIQPQDVVHPSQWWFPGSPSGCAASVQRKKDFIGHRGEGERDMLDLFFPMML